MLWALVFAATHVASLVLGAYLASSIAAGKFLPRPKYSLPKTSSQPKLTEEQLIAAALIDPNFSRTRIVNSPAEVPTVANEKYMLRSEAEDMVGGASGAFQRVFRRKAVDPAAADVASAEAAKRDRSGSRIRDGADSGSMR